jgi:TPR repeat protein
MERREDYGYRGGLTSLADEGNAEAQLKYGCMVYSGEGLCETTSFAVHDSKSSADQGHAKAQLNYGLMLSRGEDISMNKSLEIGRASCRERV